MRNFKLLKSINFRKTIGFLKSIRRHKFSDDELIFICSLVIFGALLVRSIYFLSK